MGARSRAADDGAVGKRRPGWLRRPKKRTGVVAKSRFGKPGSGRKASVGSDEERVHPGWGSPVPFRRWPESFNSPPRLCTPP